MRDAGWHTGEWRAGDRLGPRAWAFRYSIMLEWPISFAAVQVGSVLRRSSARGDGAQQQVNHARLDATMINVADVLYALANSQELDDEQCEGVCSDADV